MKYENYNEFNVSKSACRECEVGLSYDKVVCSDGNKVNPIVMITGECPGADEITLGLPFIGKAGKLLRSTMNEFGFRQTNSLISNIMPCRPFKNKFPTDNKLVKNCFDKWLKNEILLTRPKFILMCGAKPLKFLLGLEGITKIRGNWQTLEIEGLEIQCMPTLHPSYVLRKQYMDDGQMIRNRFRADVRDVGIAAEFIEEEN